MNRQIIDITDDTASGIVIKTPRETNRSTVESPEYISEVWYRDPETQKVCQPVLQTPRLRVQYSSRSYPNSPSVSYCVSMYNRDIDPEIEEFYNFLCSFDKRVVECYRANKGVWDMRGIANKYWTALVRKNEFGEYYLRLKLINDPDGKIITSVHDSNRVEKSYTDIVYGMYTDQYISPTWILFNKDGIHPCWSAHQVIISNVEKVFLNHCLLDSVLGPSNVPAPPLPPPPPSMLPPPSVAQNRRMNEQQSPAQTQAPMPIVSPMSVVNVADLKSAISKLKSISHIKKPEKPQESMHPITEEELQKKKREMDKKSIMLDSIADFPVEGGDDI